MYIHYVSNSVHEIAFSIHPSKLYYASKVYINRCLVTVKTLHGHGNVQKVCKKEKRSVWDVQVEKVVKC